MAGALERKRQGAARAIGVSHFEAAPLERVEAAGLPPPEANQIEPHPWSHEPALAS